MSTFYKISKLPNVIELMQECKDEAFSIRIESLGDDWTRHSDSISFEALLSVFKEQEMIWVFIHRQNTWHPTTMESNVSYFEIGGRTLSTEKDYFLFMYLTEESALKIKHKFKII